MKHQTSNIKYQILLSCIVLLASFLRLHQLGQNPPSLDWDEASLGYNAYSILKTGKDEFGRFLPVSIRSFEDYKPAFYTYAAIPTVALFGLNEFAVRLPSALFGILTVLVSYFLARDLFGKKIGLLVSLFLAVSPWHLQFSRVAFEANVALFWVTLGIWSFHKGLKSGIWFILSALAFAISFYTYHSPRLVVPLLLLGLLILWRRTLWEKRGWLLISAVVGALLLIPFIKEVTSEGRARLGSVTVLTPEGRLDESIKRAEYDQSRHDWLGKILHNRRIVYALAVAQGYLDHFNLDFLFLTGDSPLRHHAPDMGMLYVWDAAFIVIGVLTLLRRRYVYLWWWFLVAPAASAITTGTPHAVRALLYLPLYQIFTAVGVIKVWCWSKSHLSGHAHQIFRGFIILLFLVNIAFYLEMYYVHAPIESAKEWQFGYKQAVAEIVKQEPNVEKVVMTYGYDQPHVYLLFNKPIDPSWYQSLWHGGEVKRDTRSFDKYEFRKIDWETDKQLRNTLFVGTPGEIPPDAPGLIAQIYFPDGSVAFRIVKS